MPMFPTFLPLHFSNIIITCNKAQGYWNYWSYKGYGHFAGGMYHADTVFGRVIQIQAGRKKQEQDFMSLFRLPHDYKSVYSFLLFCTYIFELVSWR